MDTEHIENKRSGVFLMDACGSQALFQGCLRVTAPTRSRGDITTHYCYVGGIALPVARTRATPTSFTPNVEAPMRVLWPWYHRQCPFTLVVAFKTCYEGWEISRWDSEIDYAIYLPDAEITTEGFTSNLSQGLDDAEEVLMSTISLNVPDWILFEKNFPASLDPSLAAIGHHIRSISYCGGPLCASLSNYCNQPYDPGCLDIWVGGDMGTLWLSQDGGNTWEDKQGTGAGQLDLSDALYGQMDVLAVYCDRAVVLVSTENGCIYYSHDGGDNWTTPATCPQMAVSFGAYMKNIFAAGSGLWESIDDGVSWEEVLEGDFTDVDFTEGGVGLALTANALYRSADGGTTWTATTAPGLAAMTSVQQVNGRVWVAGGDGMAYSNDQGQNWTTINTDAWNDMLWLNCYIGYRIAGATQQNGQAYTTDPLEYTLDGGINWWALPINGYAKEEELNVLAACYDRLMIGGDDGVLAQLVTKSRMAS